MRNRIIDAFTFYDGLDVLEIRLNALAPYVDRFIICESPYDMTGREKELIFQNNTDRFKDFPITHLVVQNHLDHMGGWEPYYYQLNYMMKGMEDLDENDMVLVSDFDEIPDLSNYDGITEGGFTQRMYYYYLNVFTGKNNWKGTVAAKKKNIIHGLAHIRRRRARVVRIARGWHFSYISSPEEIVKKIESFCHQELNTEEIKNNIAENVRLLKDPFGRDMTFIVEEPTGPKWLIENRRRYEHLFFKQ